MVASPKRYHLKCEGLPPEIGGSPKADGQIDLPEGQHVMPRNDTVERHHIDLEPRPTDPNEIQGLGI